MKSLSGRKTHTTGNPALDRRIRRLVERAREAKNIDLLEGMVMTAFKVCEEDMHRGDIKLLSTALKELRYAFKIFYSYRHVRKVAMFGSARVSSASPEYRQARDFARRIVERGWMVITGASSGIMNAGNEGAGRENSFGVNVRLPNEQAANPVIANDPKLINFKYFFTRKLIFIRESDATVLCPGGFGTHDEGFETLTLMQTGKTNPRPLICLDPPGSTYWSSWRTWIQKHLVKAKMLDPLDLKLIKFTHDIDEAVNAITDFYRNYHSLRYIGDLLVIRLKRPLTGRLLDRLNRNFRDVLLKDKIRQQDSPFEEERGSEPFYTEDLARLSFYYNRRNFSRLKQLIDEVNEA